MPKLTRSALGVGAFAPALLAHRRPCLCASGALAVGALAVGVGVRESCRVVVATLSEEEEVRLCR